MPHKDPEARRAYNRARYARLLACDPQWAAEEARKKAEYFKKRSAEDAAFVARRKENFKKWYDLYGKDNAQERKGYVDFEEYAAKQDAKRQASHAKKKAWYQTEAGRRYVAKRTIMRRCGLSIDEYDSVYDQQQGKCRICGEAKDRYGQDRLVVDHCHESGKFRALLCANCNTAIGLLGENPETLMRAIKYLEEVRAIT